MLLFLVSFPIAYTLDNFLSLAKNIAFYCSDCNKIFYSQKLKFNPEYKNPIFQFSVL